MIKAIAKIHLGDIRNLSNSSEIIIASYIRYTSDIQYKIADLKAIIGRPHLTANDLYKILDSLKKSKNVIKSYKKPKKSCKKDCYIHDVKTVEVDEKMPKVLVDLIHLKELAKTPKLLKLYLLGRFYDRNPFETKYVSISEWFGNVRARNLFNSLKDYEMLGNFGVFFTELEITKHIEFKVKVDKLVTVSETDKFDTKKLKNKFEKRIFFEDESVLDIAVMQQIISLFYQDYLEKKRISKTEKHIDINDKDELMEYLKKTDSWDYSYLLALPIEQLQLEYKKRQSYNIVKFDFINDPCVYKKLTLTREIFNLTKIFTFRLEKLKQPATVCDGRFNATHRLLVYPNLKTVPSDKNYLAMPYNEDMDEVEEQLNIKIDRRYNGALTRTETANLEKLYSKNLISIENTHQKLLNRKSVKPMLEWIHQLLRKAREDIMTIMRINLNLSELKYKGKLYKAGYYLQFPFDMPSFFFFNDSLKAEGFIYELFEIINKEYSFDGNVNKIIMSRLLFMETLQDRVLKVLEEITLKNTSLENMDHDFLVKENGVWKITIDGIDFSPNKFTRGGRERKAHIIIYK
jgi:hypothetical protein